MKRIFYLLGIAFLLITCCKHDEPGADPCEAIRNEPEGFKIEEFMYDLDEDIVFESEDTVLAGNMIRFTSNRKYDSYT